MKREKDDKKHKHNTTVTQQEERIAAMNPKITASHQQPSLNTWMRTSRGAGEAAGSIWLTDFGSADSVDGSVRFQNWPSSESRQESFFSLSNDTHKDYDAASDFETFAAGKLGGLPTGTDSQNAEIVNAILAGEVVNLESEDDVRKSESYKDNYNDEDNEEDHDGDDMINPSSDIALEDTIGISNGYSIVSLWIAVTSRPQRLALKHNPIHWTYW